MRKLIALALAVATLSMGAPTAALAQSAARFGSVSGEAVDAGGRAMQGLRVELVQAGVVVQTTTTGLSGTYSFANVPAGDYIVRVMVNDMPAGVRVAVTAGVPATATIVVPSAVAPSQPPVLLALAALGPIFGTVVVAAAIAAVTTAVVVATGS